MLSPGLFTTSMRFEETGSLESRLADLIINAVETLPPIDYGSDGCSTSATQNYYYKHPIVSV